MEEHGGERSVTRDTTCPACGSPAERGQLVCLVCGARLALDYRRPVGWKLPVAIITVVLVLAGGGLAYALSEIDEHADAEVADTPARNAGKGKAGKQGNGSKRARAKSRTREPRRAGGRPARGRPAARREGTWPTGRNGFTVVLVSTDERSNALSVTRDVSRRGTRAGYLRSDDYSSLQPGLWLVFSGVYKTRAEAERAVGRVSRAFPGAFVQFVNGAAPNRRR